LIGGRPSGAPEDSSSESNESPHAVPEPPEGDPTEPELDTRVRRYVPADKTGGKQ